MQPSPSLGPPALSASWSPPPCGIQLVFGVVAGGAAVVVGGGFGVVCCFVVAPNELAEPRFDGVVWPARFDGVVWAAVGVPVVVPGAADV